MLNIVYTKVTFKSQLISSSYDKNCENSYIPQTLFMILTLESLRSVKDPSNKEKSSRQFFLFHITSSHAHCSQIRSNWKGQIKIREALGFLLFLSPHMYIFEQICPCSYVLGYTIKTMKKKKLKLIFDTIYELIYTYDMIWNL